MYCSNISYIPLCLDSNHHNSWTEHYWAMFICDVLLEHLIHPGMYTFSSPQQVNETILRNIHLWCVVRTSHQSRFVSHPITTAAEQNTTEQCWFVMCCWIIWCIPFCLLSHNHNSWTELSSVMLNHDVLFYHLMHPLLSSLTSPQQVNGTMVSNVYLWCAVRTSHQSRFVSIRITTTADQNTTEQCWFVTCCWMIWCIPFCLLSHHYNRWTELSWAMLICDVLLDHLMHPIFPSLTSPQQVNRSILGNVYSWCNVWSYDESRFVFPHITTTNEQNYHEQCWFLMWFSILWCIPFRLLSHHHNR